MSDLDTLLRIIFDNLQAPTQAQPNRVISRYTDAKDPILMEDEVSLAKYTSRAKWGDGTNNYCRYDENSEEVRWN